MVDEANTNNMRSEFSGKRVEPVIEIAGLHYSWPRSDQAVLAIDHFKVNSGERLFIMGPSGSGKSTLLSVLTGILLPQGGHVKVLGKDIHQLKAAERDRFRADNIGYIFQMFNLVPYLSVVENVILPCQFSSHRKTKIQQSGASPEKEALRLLGHLNLKDQELLDKPVVELSVGQQQRVAAARALIGNPALVIADEPTSSLDTEHRESFLTLLFDECARADATLIFVSHDSSLVSLFDRVVELKEINKGSVSSRGSSV